MGRVLKFLGIICVSVVAILAAAVAIALLLPDDTYRKWVTEATRSATGRDLELGDFSVDVGRSLIVDARGVSFASSDWARESALFSAERLRAELVLLPLLSGTVELTVGAETPQLNLETDPSGRGNWELAREDSARNSGRSREPGQGFALKLIPKLEIAEGRIVFLDGVSGEQERLELHRLDLGDNDGRLLIGLEGTFRDEAVTLKADLGELREILGGGSSDGVAEARLGEVFLSAKGRYANLLGPPAPTIDLAVALSSASTASLEPFAGRPIPDLGRLAVSARLARRDGAFAGRELTLQIDGPDTAIEASGEIEDLMALAGVDLDLRLTSNSVPALAAAFGITLPDEAPESVSVDFSVQSRGDGYEIPAIDVLITGDDINGAIKGHIADLVALTGIELDVRAYIDSLAPYSSLAGIELPDTTPLTLTANVSAARGAADEARVSAELASDWLKGQLRAKVAELGTFQGVDGDFNLEVQSLALFSGTVGRELPPMGPVTAKARLLSRDRSYALTDITVSIREGPLQGGFSGEVSDLLALAGVNLDIDTRLASLANFSGLAATELPETRPLRLHAKASSARGLQGPADLRATIDSDWLTGQVEATLANAAEVTGLAATIDLNIAALSDLSTIVGQELPAMGPLSASAKIASREETFALTGLSMKLNDASLDTELKGSVLDLLAMRGIDMELTGRTATLASLGPLAGAELPDTPPIDLQARLVAKGGVQAPTEISATLESEGIRADVQGSLPQLTGTQGTQLAVFLKAATLGDLGKLAGVPVAELSPVELRANVITSESGFDLNSLFAVIGKSDLRGDLKIELPREGGKGSVTGLFESRILDATELMAAMRRPGGSPTVETQGTASNAATSGNAAAVDTASSAASASVFSDEPLPLELLERYDGYLEAKAAQLRLPDIAVNEGRMTVDLDGGRLELVLHRADVGGRPVDGELEIDASQRPVPIHFELHANRVPVSGVLAEDSLLEGGALFADIDLDARGSSVRQLMASLDGHVSLAIRDTRLSDVLLRRFGTDIIRQINPLTADRGYSGIECAAAALEASDGMVTTPRGLIAVETEATWIGQGEINLDTEAILFNFSSKPRKGLGLSAGALASAIQFSGTLANPTLTPNPIGVAQKGAEAALALTTGGMSILAKGLLDRATTDSGVCEEIVKTIIEGRSRGDGAG